VNITKKRYWMVRLCPGQGKHRWHTDDHGNPRLFWDRKTAEVIAETSGFVGPGMAVVVEVRAVKSFKQK